MTCSTNSIPLIAVDPQLLQPPPDGLLHPLLLLPALLPVGELAARHPALLLAQATRRVEHGGTLAAQQPGMAAPGEEIHPGKSYS